MMAVSNNDNEPITYYIIKTLFMLEVNAIDPQTGNTTPLIVPFFILGVKKTFGN